MPKKRTQAEERLEPSAPLLTPEEKAVLRFRLLERLAPGCYVMNVITKRVGTFQSVDDGLYGLPNAWVSYEQPDGSQITFSENPLELRRV